MDLVSKAAFGPRDQSPIAVGATARALRVALPSKVPRRLINSRTQPIPRRDLAVPVSSASSSAMLARKHSWINENGYRIS